MSSASNILITILAARVLDPASFGRFGIVFLVYVGAQGVARALVSEPLLIRPDESEERPGEAVGTAVLVGLAVGVAIGGAGATTAIWDAEAGSALLVLAACMPFLVLQDLGRYLGVATHRPGRALGLDVVWLGVSVVAIGLAVATDRQTLCWFLAAWAGSGAASSVLLRFHVRARIELGFVWLRETWSFAKRYVLSFAALQGGILAGSVVLAAVLGASALGAVRGALLLFGPVVQLQAASVAAGVSEVARMAPGSPDLGRHVRRTTALTTAAAVGNLAIVLLLPDALGEAVLGDTWAATEDLLWPAGAQMLFLGAISGVRSTLLGLKAVRTTLRMDVATTVITFTTTVTGALTGGVVTAFWCLAGGQAVIAVLWWLVYADRLRQ